MQAPAMANLHAYCAGQLWGLGSVQCAALSVCAWWACALHQATPCWVAHFDAPFERG